MNDIKRLAVLENALAQMLKPVRGIPFGVVIKSLSEKEVINSVLLEQLKLAITLTSFEVQKNPIRRRRPNEVGNDIEPLVMKGLAGAKLKVMRPTSLKGHRKSYRLSRYSDL